MPWLCAQTKSLQERRTARGITQRCGANVLLPLLKSAVIIKNNQRIYKLPLFPGYLFIEYKNDSLFYNLRFIEGFIRILKFDGSISFVPQDFIDMIIKRTDSEGYWIEVEMKDYIYEGQKVKFKDSLYCSLDGIVATTTCEERVNILINILGSQRKVEVGRNELELCEVT